MKFSLAVLGVFGAVMAYSQTTSSEDAMDAQINRQLMLRPPSQNLLIATPEKANEIRGNGVSYSGIFVELIKTDKPLELINPAAPPEYGSSEDNVARDPITRKVSGLKLFSIQF